MEQSAFLREIDVELLDCINHSNIRQVNQMTTVLPKTCFSVGDMVRHKIFGKGRIVGVDENFQVYTIAFENVNGVRRLQFRADLQLMTEK